MLYRYAFPSERSRVPDQTMMELLRRSWQTIEAGDWERPLCRGSLLSKAQYRHALDHLGYEDPRAGTARVRHAWLDQDRDAGEEEADGAAVSPGSGG